MANNEFGLTDEGFAIKRFPRILEDINARTLRAFPGADIIPPSLLGTYNNIMALGFTETYEVLQSIANSIDINNASGSQLDQLGFFKNIFRNLGESDVDFRKRILLQAQEFYVQNSQEERICSALRNISFVTDAIVVVNESSTTSASGIPANSYTPVVFVDQTEDLTQAQKLQIARVLLAQHPLGTSMYANETDDGYCQYAIPDSCGACKIVRFIRATQIDAGIDLVLRSYVGCDPCTQVEAQCYANDIATAFNANNGVCTRISPSINITNIYGAFGGRPPVEVVGYRFRLFDPNVDDCDSPFFTSGQNANMDTAAELLNLQAAGLLPTFTGFNTQYVFLNWNPDCFTVTLRN